ncbi:MAG: hypothetical protein A2Y62_19195 [Candidatus Fischerbacteria bacterium RBG_13_37_8]|uniref:Uncharacterized protein n=1 Tax=Candidatus Fischerbacteria bacterium RBG_13_37_8 TaxID=1817863 RepID=A0A1F5VU40_9BACT|nr:MAG: hypothetical protein A2Y62_19195 [Candidatus Fischerbacteria bacterium RBG_13_37_8]
MLLTPLRIVTFASGKLTMTNCRGLLRTRADALVCPYSMLAKNTFLCITQKRGNNYNPIIYIIMLHLYNYRERMINIYENILQKNVKTY